MAEAPKINQSSQAASVENATASVSPAKVQFPYASQQDRLNKYSQNDQLFKGQHFLAFANMAKDTDFRNDYERLRYVIANFAGLISKVSADIDRKSVV